MVKDRKQQKEQSQAWSSVAGLAMDTQFNQFNLFTQFNQFNQLDTTRFHFQLTEAEESPNVSARSWSSHGRSAASHRPLSVLHPNPLPCSLTQDRHELFHTGNADSRQNVSDLISPVANVMGSSYPPS